MWELVRAYGAFQSGGLRMDPYLIDKIEDSRGMVLYQRPEYERERVYPYQLAEDMNAMMTRVVNAPIGTGRGGPASRTGPSPARPALRRTGATPGLSALPPPMSARSGSAMMMTAR